MHAVRVCVRVHVCVCVCVLRDGYTYQVHNMVLNVDISQVQIALKTLA